MGSVEFFKSYMESTLGVRYFPFESITEAASQPAVKLVVVDLPWARGLGEVEMFQKMMAAIGFALTDLEIIEALPGEVHHHLDKVQGLRAQGVPMLFFSPDLHKVMKMPEGGELAPVIVTYGPRDIERNAALKRETWSALQKIKQV